MAASSKRAKRIRRRERIANHDGIVKKAKRKTKYEEKVVHGKFEKEKYVPPLVPKTERQKEYIESLYHSQIVVASGHAGVGKTFLASYKAAELLQQGYIDKIIITRPYAHLGTDYGAVPGSDLEKLESFVRPMLEVLKKVLGAGKYQYCMDKGVIEVAPLEKIQGRSFDEPCAIIADECQNASRPQIVSLMTRLGEEVEFLAICGDPRQSIDKGYNTLDWTVDFLERNNIDGVSVVKFKREDCVRSGIVKAILFALEDEGGYYSDL